MNKMIEPNLFILGAPKCGTTSLAHWLSLHPDIYLSKAKEPHYFNKDHSNNTYLDFDHYMSLFKSAKDFTIVGEASVWYLYSKVAVSNILNTFGSDVKFIVMLRNPVNMAYSLYEQQIYNINEDQPSFELAWNLQDSRRKGRNIPKDTRDVSMILYGQACKLGKQVQRLLEQVDREQVHFIFLDDIKTDTRTIYKETLKFLQVQDDGRIEFPPLNAGKKRKITILSKIIKRLGLLKRRLGFTKGIGFLNSIDSLNQKDYKRPKLKKAFEETLYLFFRDDIELLEKLTETDLSHWKAK